MANTKVDPKSLPRSRNPWGYTGSPGTVDNIIRSSPGVGRAFGRSYPSPSASGAWGKENTSPSNTHRTPVTNTGPGTTAANVYRRGGSDYYAYTTPAFSPGGSAEAASEWQQHGHSRLSSSPQRSAHSPASKSPQKSAGGSQRSAAPSPQRPLSRHAVATAVGWCTLEKQCQTFTQQLKASTLQPSGPTY